MNQSDNNKAFYICRKSTNLALDGTLDFWHHATHTWQWNNPDSECQYPDAAQAHHELNSHTADMANAWVGNRYFQQVDESGELIKAAR